jgi:hypothetical protein
LREWQRRRCLSGPSNSRSKKRPPPIRPNEKSARLLGASEELFREVGVAIDTGEAETRERIRAGLYDALGAERAEELRSAGASMRAEELVA